jgi:cell shape-determining protein MreD
MRKISCLALGVVLVAFQSSLFSFLPLEVTKPDMGMPFIIYAIFFLSPFDGLIAALVFGFGQEVLSAGPAGSVLFVHMALLLTCLFVKSRLYIESRYTFSLVCAASVLFEALLFLAVSLLAKGETKDFFNVLLYSIPDAIATGFISLFMFSLFQQFKLRYPGRV